jgi:cobalt-zinc-cadmium efflux system outer membrane protein
VSSDVRSVRELTNADRIAEVADVDVDPVSAERAKRLLEGSLDADQAVRVALLNNRELRAKLRELGVARGKALQASLLPNPVVEAELLPERNSQIELRAEYDVTHALLTPLRYRAVAPDIDAARYRAAAAVVELGYRVRVAFYRLQAAEQRLALTQRILDGFAAEREATLAMREAGNVPALSTASMEAAYGRAQVTAARVELEVATERENVQRLLGAHGAETTWRVLGELPEAPETLEVPDNLETRTLRASLDLLAARQRMEGLARSAGYARVSGWIPEIAIDVHGLHGDPEEGAAPDPEWRFGAGLSLEVPLFDRNQGTVAALDAELQALLERYYGKAVDIRSGVREARNRRASAHARVRHYGIVILPAQRRVVEQTVLQYNAMQVGLFELLEARREELEAQLAHVETLREYWSAEAELGAFLAGGWPMANAGTGAMDGAMAHSSGTLGGH